MTTKEFLQQPLDIEAQINADLLEIQRIRSLAEKTTSTISCDPVSNGRSGGRVEEYAILLVGLMGRVEDAHTELGRVRNEVQSKIELLSKPEEQTVLWFRYLDNMKWSDICADMWCSRTQANNIHDRAIINLGEILQNS